MRQTVDRVWTISSVACGGATNLWVGYVPEDVPKFMEALDRLNPQGISFDVVQEKELNRIRARFPAACVSAVCVAKSSNESGQLSWPASEGAEAMDHGEGEAVHAISLQH